MNAQCIKSMFERWCCVGGGYLQDNFVYQLSLKCKLVTPEKFYSRLSKRQPFALTKGCSSKRQLQNFSAAANFIINLVDKLRIIQGRAQIQKFLSECLTRQLTSERSECRVEHEKRNFMSTSNLVSFCLSYEHNSPLLT